MRRLAGAGVLRGYHAQVDPGALGIGLEAMVAIRIAKHEYRWALPNYTPAAQPA